MAECLITHTDLYNFFLYSTKVLRTSPSWRGCLLTSSSAPPSLLFPRILSTSHTSASGFVRRENCTTMYVGGNTADVSSAESLGLADMSPSVCGCGCVICPAQIEGSQTLHSTHCIALPQGSSVSTCLQQACQHLLAADSHVDLTATVSYQTIVVLCSFQSKWLEWRSVVSIL
jgi:hypothetical protein